MKSPSEFTLAPETQYVFNHRTDINITLSGDKKTLTIGDGAAEAVAPDPEKS